MTDIPLPNSVRYVKNGRGGQWWHAAKNDNQIHLGWKSIPHELLRIPDFSKIEDLLRIEIGDRPAATQDFNALQELLNRPSKHIWITFQDRFMW